MCVHRNISVHLTHITCFTSSWHENNGLILVVMMYILLALPLLQRFSELVLGSSKEFLRWTEEQLLCFLYFQSCGLYSNVCSGGLQASDCALLLLPGPTFKVFPNGHCHESYSCHWLWPLLVLWSHLPSTEYRWALQSLQETKAKLTSLWRWEALPLLAYTLGYKKTCFRSYVAISARTSYWK